MSRKTKGRREKTKGCNVIMGACQINVIFDYGSLVEMHVKCIRNALEMHLKCMSNAFPMRWECISNAFQMHWKCISNAFEMHLSAPHGPSLLIAAQDERDASPNAL